MPRGPERTTAKILKRLDGERPRAAPNGGCLKCGRKKNRELHHIVPILEGGGDEAENLCYLCHLCHLEWAVAEAGLALPFERWLEFPPLPMLLGAFLPAHEPTTLLSEFVHSTRVTLHARKRSPDPERLLRRLRSKDDAEYALAVEELAAAEVDLARQASPQDP